MTNTVRLGVGVLVVKDNKFLLMKRQGAHGANTWAPPGGHIEFGESFEDTARREVKEESGLEIKNIRFCGVTNDYFIDENKHYVTVWIMSDWASGTEQIMEPEKCLEQGWFTFDDIPSNLFLPVKHFMTSEFFDRVKDEIGAGR